MQKSPNIQDTLKMTLETMHEGLQIISRDWRYLYVNSAAAAHGHSSVEKLAGKTMMECYPGFDETEGFKDLKYVMESRNPRRVENHFQYPDGKTCWFELWIEPHPLGLLIRSMDITARKKIEEQLVHAQKMEAIGQMAGGIAHEFNNKLATMLTYCEMALAEISEQDHQMKTYLEAILRSVQTSAQVTRKILAFSRKQVLAPEVTDLNGLVLSMSATLNKTMGATIEMEHALAKDIHPVNVDPVQMEQAILNLCLNARDAMPDGGKLLIETSNVELDENYCRDHANVSPGRYVMVAVSDTGHGMDKATLARIFEPFFTTKEKGKGTGLGLAVVHGMISQSSGHLFAYSEPNMGSVFKIFLPAVAEVPTYESGKPEPKPTLGGNECILLVEDDELLRQAYETALTRAGYLVLACRDGMEAKKVFMNEMDKIHLVLTDVVLPKMKGTELAASVRKIKPDVRVVFMSGYTENSVVHSGVLDADTVLIQKPISIRNMLDTLRKVLDGLLKKGVV